MKFTEHEGGMSFKLDTIEQTLSVYLQWEGIIGYDHMILEMKGWSEDDIDDVLREEGIYGFSGDIHTILEGKSAFCAGMDTDDFLNVCREQGIDVSGEKPDIFVATEGSEKPGEKTLAFSVFPEYAEEDLTNTILDKLISADIRYHSAKKLAGNYYVTIIGNSYEIHKATIVIESLVFFKEWIQKSSTEPVSSSKPKEGDRVVVSYYQHPNNGLKGVVTSKVGNLCWVKTDEYGTMTFIDTFLDKIDDTQASEGFEDDFNKSKPTKEYNIGSNKLISQTGDTRTLSRLKKLAEQLERDSELGFKYVIEDGYEDVGANMRWTSIAAVRPDGSSHWAISPGEWVTLANGDDDSIVDVVQASIQSDEFFQDKKEKEPMNKRVITSAKEGVEDYDVLDRYRFSGDYLERIKYLIFDISDKGALSEFIEELENWEDITWLYEDEDDPEESLNQFSNYEPGGKVFDINGTHFYVTADGSDVYTEDDDPEGTFRVMMEDDSMRGFLERHGLIVELDEDEIRDNLGLEPLEDEEEEDDGEIDDYSAEEGLSDGKDYIVKLKCNDNPFHTVKFISESDDIDEIVAIAKKYYEHNYVTYADDRANNWVIDEILENGKVRGVPLEYTDDFENAFED